ncbi:hypothetical protein [Zeaxanthinibacter enoshimensis]|nr:hypothetical protein [Zeaxanthinibacter enoshimensis]
MNGRKLGMTNGMMGVGTANPTSTLHTAGSLATGIRSTTTATTLTANDHTLILYGTAEYTVTLPFANTCPGRIYILKNLGDKDVFTNLEYIDDKGDRKSKIDNDKIFWLQSDGTNWHLIYKP